MLLLEVFWRYILELSCKQFDPCPLALQAHSQTAKRNPIGHCMWNAGLGSNISHGDDLMWNGQAECIFVDLLALSWRNALAHRISNQRIHQHRMFLNIKIVLRAKFWTWKCRGSRLVESVCVALYWKEN